MSRRPIRSHRDLEVWRAAMRLRRQVYLIVRQLPREERWEIGSQSNRAAQSIPSNIAEGHERPGRADYRQFVSMARGSAGELDTHLIAIHCDHEQLRPQVRSALQLLDEVSRMLTRLHQSLG